MTFSRMRRAATLLLGHASIARSWRLLTLFALHACGGGDAPAGPATPAPPQTVTPVATTVAMQAGDGQTAPAGSAVPVAPSVLVKDQNGRAMAGVSVAFSVDSGGGRVTLSSAASGSDGVASSGGWTLGVGRNVLKATVSGLPAVTFVGTATGELIVIDQQIPIAGGTITVSRPGDALNGMQVTLPAGAYSRAIQLSVRYGDNSGAPAKTSMRLASPVISIASDAPGYTATTPIALRIPARVAAGEWPVVVAFSRSTGALEVLPSTRVDTTGVIAVTRQLSATWLMPTPGAAARLFTTRTADSDLQLAVYGVAISELAKDVDTGYRPSVDDWEFSYYRTATRTQLENAPGLPIASAWYFTQYKPSRGNLNGRYQEAQGVPLSNQRGIRLAALAGRLIDVPALRQLDAGIAGAAVAAGMSADSLRFLNMKAGMLVTGRPQMLLAADPTGIATPVAMLAYRARGATLDLTLGTSANDINAPRSVSLVNGVFGAINWSYIDPFGGASQVNASLTAINVTGQTAGLSLVQLDQLWSAFFSGTIGDAEFHGTDIASRDVRPVRDTLFVPDDTNRVWMECPTCTAGYPPIGVETFAQAKVGTRAAYEARRNPDGSWGTFSKSATIGFGDVQYVDVTVDANAIFKYGFATATAPQNNGPAPLYSGWKEVVVRAKRLVVAPKPLNGVTDTDYELTASYDRPLPPNPRWEWRLGDGRTITTTVNRVTISYPEKPGTPLQTFDIKVSLKSGTQLEATGRTQAVIADAKLIITPDPLIGGYDVDYTLTATASQPAPPNASWTWDLGDNRTVTTQTNQVTVRYPAPTPVVAKTFAIKVTLKSGTNIVGKGQGTAEIGPRLPVWKFTSLAVEVSNPGPSAADLAGGVFGFWTKDVERWQNIHVGSGSNDGGILFLADDAVVDGDLKKRGLYILDGKSITPTTLARSLSFVNEVTFSPAPTGDSIRTIWHVYQPFDPLLSTTQPGLDEFYTATGSASSGTVSGQKWIGHDTYVRQSFPPYLFPRYIRRATVTFNGGTASGTIEYIARAPMDFTRPPFYERRRWTIIATFTATRIQ